jgi:hypothetical protein
MSRYSRSYRPGRHETVWVLSSGMSRYSRSYRRGHHGTLGPIVGYLTIQLILSPGMSCTGWSYRRECHDTVDHIVGDVTKQCGFYRQACHEICKAPLASESRRFHVAPVFCFSQCWRFTFYRTAPKDNLKFMMPRASDIEQFQALLKSLRFQYNIEINFISSVRY